MNKTELIAAVAERTNMTKKDVENTMTAMLDTIMERVAAGEDIRIVGFGTFERRERKERKGCDPRTNQEIIIPASKIPAFKAGKAFRDKVDAE